MSEVNWTQVRRAAEAPPGKGGAAMTAERCPRCDRPKLWECPEGVIDCRCAKRFPDHCLKGEDCDVNAIDWRARCLAAEAGKRIDDMLERRVAKANRIADDATFIAHRALVEGLAECERLRAMASTLSAFDILIGAPSKEMTEADLVEAMARLVTDPPSPMMDAREGAAAREQAIRADSAREERERVVACVDAMRASAQRSLDWARKDGDWHIVDRRRLELEVLADVKDGINTAHAPGKGGEG